MVNNVSNKTLASVGSGLAATACGHPLDLLRARLLFGNSIKNLTSLSKGLTFSLGLSALKSGSVWPIREALLENIKARDVEGMSLTILTGGVGNIIPNILCAPLNITRVHLLREEGQHTAFQVAQKIYKTAGFTGFYAGTPLTIARDFVWGLVYFPVMSTLKVKFQKLSPGQNEATIDFQASTVAATIATGSSSVLDALRLHKMNSDKVKYVSYRHTLIKALLPTKANLLSTASGVGRVALTTAIAHTTYNYIVRQSNHHPTQKKG